MTTEQAPTRRVEANSNFQEELLNKLKNEYELELAVLTWLLTQTMDRTNLFINYALEKGKQPYVLQIALGTKIEPTTFSNEVLQVTLGKQMIRFKTLMSLPTNNLWQEVKKSPPAQHVAKRRFLGQKREEALSILDDKVENLRKRKPKLTNAQISSVLGLSHMAIYRSVKRLERKGLVDRRKLQKEQLTILGILVGRLRKLGSTNSEIAQALGECESNIRNANTRMFREGKIKRKKIVRPKAERESLGAKLFEEEDLKTPERQLARKHETTLSTIRSTRKRLRGQKLIDYRGLPPGTNDHYREKIAKLRTEEPQITMREISGRLNLEEWQTKAFLITLYRRGTIPRKRPRKQTAS